MFLASRGRRPHMLPDVLSVTAPATVSDPTSSGPSAGVEKLWTGKCRRASLCEFFLNVK